MLLASAHRIGPGRNACGVAQRSWLGLGKGTPTMILVSYQYAAFSVCITLMMIACTDESTIRYVWHRLGTIQR
jgi:hypothetical protein